MVRISFCVLGVSSITIPVSSLYHPHQSFIFSKSQGQNSFVHCRVIGGCESSFSSEDSLYKPAARLSYWTHKRQTSRKSISSIDKHTPAWMHVGGVQWNTGGEVLVTADICKHAESVDKTFKGPFQNTHITYAVINFIPLALSINAEDSWITDSRSVMKLVCLCV